MSTTTIEIAATSPTLDALLAITATGEEVVLTKHGIVLARLVPEPTPTMDGPRCAGSQPNAFTFVAEDFDAPLPDDFLLGGKP